MGQVTVPPLGGGVDTGGGMDTGGGKVMMFCFGADLGTLAKPSYQTVLERVLGIRNRSCPVLRLPHCSVWHRTWHAGRASQI